MTPGQVRPKVDKRRTQELVSLGVARVVARHGKATVAAEGRCSEKTVGRILAGETECELSTLVNILGFDLSALDELLAGQGLRVVPLQVAPANDLDTAAAACEVAGAITRALSDGRRDHQETLAIAAMLRPLLPALTGIVREADALRGAA